MNRSIKRRQVRQSGVGTRQSLSRDYHYDQGTVSNTANDDVPQTAFVFATDTRAVKLGKWATRPGNDLLSVPIGEAINAQQTAVTGAGLFSFNLANQWAKKIVATSTGRLTALEANLKTTGTVTGTIVLVLYADNAGVPGTELFRTTIAANTVTSSLAYLKARSISCPDITSGSTYWVVGTVQEGGTGSYQISTTTNATTGLTSTNGGASWSAASLDFNVKLSTATASPALGQIRVKRPGGATITFLAHGNTLYTVNETTGATTVVDAGLDPASTYCRFAYVADVLYYVTGLQKPRKYDFTTASVVTTAPENASNIIEHKGLVFYTSTVDTSKFFYTNFGLYDVFTSTDFFYAPSPKTSDPIVAFAKLNGNLFIHTRKNKYILYGAENATFRLDNAVGQKGTFSQQSVAYDESSIFLASDDGIFQFNGAEEKNIAQDVLDWWTSLLKKSNTVIELWNNRLYVFYTPNGSAYNTRCKVWNRLYGFWESDDSVAMVGGTYTRLDPDNYFLQASNRVGMLMLAEGSTNDYNSMGEPFTYELRTKFDPSPGPQYRNVFISAAEYKRATKFRPHFDSVTGSYSISVGYALDLQDSATYKKFSLSGTGARFDTGLTFNSGVTFNSAGVQINPTDNSLVIPGQWRRLQLRYQHVGAREPVAFDGHVLAIETQRMI